MKKMICAMLCGLLLLTGAATAEETEGGMLTAAEMAFVPGGTYAVYSGPGEDYLRAEDGAAAVKAEGSVEVFGVTDGWALIQHAVGEDRMRIGYIDASALPEEAETLTLRAEDAYLKRRAALTDDPLHSQSALLTLPEGAWVTWLATMGEWAYVESTTGDAVRGFVPLSYIETHRVFELADHGFDSLAAAKGGALTVMQDGTVTLLVNDWLTKAGEHPLRFEVYGEGNTLILTAEMDETGAYRGTGSMEDGWGVVICPVYVEGTADMSAALSIQW